MASTADWAKEKGVDYTWDKAKFTWDSVEAKKSWEECYNTSFSLLTKEDISFLEKSFRFIALNKNEAIIVSAKLINIFAKPITERINIAESYLDFISYILKIQETLTLKEINPKTVRRTFYEVFEITGKLWREYLINIAQFLAFTENHNRKAQFLKQEGLNISDYLRKDYSKTVFEAVNLLVQSPFWIINKAISEDLNITDCYQDFISYIVRIQETISFIENCPKDMTITKEEALELTGYISKSALKAVSELFVLTDNTKSTKIFKRVFTETLAVVEKIAKSIGVTKFELLNIVEAYIRNTNTILSDLVFSNKDMTLDEFLQQTSSPVGYESFKDMQVGEYEYQNALIRLIVEAGALSIRPQVTEWELNIDIPDTIDRGQAVIPASTHTILFNKHYYKPPEIQITLKGTSIYGATPSVVKITENSFDVAIKDGSGNFISGVISWTSTGY